jgi:hypothetical protein
VWNLRYGGAGQTSDEGGVNKNVVVLEFTAHGLSMQAGIEYQN